MLNRYNRKMMIGNLYKFEQGNAWAIFIPIRQEGKEITCFIVSQRCFDFQQRERFSLASVFLSRAIEISANG